MALSFHERLVSLPFDIQELISYKVVRPSKLLTLNYKRTKSAYACAFAHRNVHMFARKRVSAYVRASMRVRSRASRARLCGLTGCVCAFCVCACVKNNMRVLLHFNFFFRNITRFKRHLINRFIIKL